MFENIIPNSDRWFNLKSLLNEEWKSYKTMGLYYKNI